MAKGIQRPALTVDVLVFTVADDELKVLLVRRRNPPFAGSWAIPGGFVDSGEAPDEAAVRELAEETGLRGVEVHEFGSFGEPGRDPRGWTVSIAYLGLIPPRATQVRGGDDAAEADWHPVPKPPPLAFDHSLILSEGLAALRRNSLFEPLLAPFLPQTFGWSEICKLYAVLMGGNVDRFGLRRLLLAAGTIERFMAGAGRSRYRFSRRGLLSRLGGTPEA